MPDDVRAVPYWIDDATLAGSIVQSGAASLLETSAGANQYYQHLLPHDSQGKVKVAPLPRIKQEEDFDPEVAETRYSDWYKDNCTSLCIDEEEECCAWATPSYAHHITVQKV